MDTQAFITLLAGLGIGSVLTALIQYRLKVKETAYQSRRIDLEARYKVIILLMYAAHDFKPNEAVMRIHRPDLTSRDDVLAELHAEWINMLLFASRATLDLLRHFIADPSRYNLVNCAMSMRKDLGRDPVDIRTMELDIRPNNSV